MRIPALPVLVLALVGAGCAGWGTSARPSDRERSAGDERRGLEGCIRSESDSLAAYEAAGRTADAGEARMRLRRLQEALDDLVLEFRGPLPDRRSPEQRRFEEHARRTAANTAQALESSPPFLAVRWLARHQEADGRWDGGDDRADVETTALALLVFLGFGETHRTAGFGPVVRSGFGFLAESKDAQGFFQGAEGERTCFRQAVATLAFSEALRFTGSPAFREPAGRALAACLRLRVPGGAWGVAPSAGEPDRAATAWMLIALRAGQRAGLPLEADGLTAGLAVLESATGTAAGGSLVREGEGSPIPCPRAAAAVARRMHGATFADASLRESAARALEGAPGEREPFGVWLGTILAWNLGYDSDAWKSWHSGVLVRVRESQRLEEEDPDRGSFDPTEDRTRATETALRALALEIDYRFLRALGYEL